MHLDYTFTPELVTEIFGDPFLSTMSDYKRVHFSWPVDYPTTPPVTKCDERRPCYWYEVR